MSVTVVRGLVPRDRFSPSVVRDRQIPNGRELVLSLYRVGPHPTSRPRHATTPYNLANLANLANPAHVLLQVLGLARVCPSLSHRVHERSRGTGPRATGRERVFFLRRSGSGDPELQR